MRRKKIFALVLAVTMASSMSMTSFASQWQQNATGWWYQEDNGTWPANTWKWIDGKCYYFDGNGYMLSNTTTPDGYQVDASGAWVVNGVVQTQGTGSVNHSANYDPAHPLAGKIDEWDLRLPNNVLGASEVSTSNVQAMLTGQMDQYYAAPIGESVNPFTGTKGYVTETDYNNARKYENDLYNWYCNWLNSFDFQNMTEMERAKEIQKVLASASYIEGTAGNYDYGVLIDKKGQCTDFAMTARSLATALGLKNAVSGYGVHSVYYIWVDGKQYMGSNQYLNLDYPSSL